MKVVLTLSASRPLADASLETHWTPAAIRFWRAGAAVRRHHHEYDRARYAWLPAVTLTRRKP